jgi:tetratricopeptide (TPR) repeat protein
MGLQTIDDLRAALRSGAAPTPAASAPAAPPTAAQPAASAPKAASQAPGIPVANPQRLAEIDAEIDAIVQRFFADIDVPEITWQQKTRRRAGDRDPIVLRVMVTTATLLTTVVVLGGAFLLLISTPEGRAVVFAPTATFTLSPTVTPTNTPGATPTPSRTPEITSTPSATIPPSITPALQDRNFPPTPTDVFPEISNRRVSEGLLLIEQGNAPTALPMLATARAELGTTYDAAPYYYSALALIADDQLADAEQMMVEAEEQMEVVGLREEDRLRQQPLIDTGFAQVYLAQAQAAYARRSPGTAADALNQVIERTNSAIAAQPRLATPYVLQARAHVLRENYDEALSILTDGLLVPELANDLNLLVERAEVYYAEEDYESAAYWAFYVLYLNPFLQQAHDVQIRTAIARNDPGLAVIYTQQYLYYYPGSVAGYRLLGDSRVAEGNPDLALVAYTQALQGDPNDPAYVPTLLSLAALFEEQERYADALSLYDRAVELDETPEIQALRMRAAYNAGEYGVAEDIANELLESGDGIVPASELNLLLARVTIDRARPTDTEVYEEALSLLERATAGGLDAELRPIADEYRARAQFALEDYENALSAINEALNAGESGSRYLLRARIFEALQCYDEAVRDYQWVLTWSSIYPYPFADEAQQGAERAAELALIEPTEEP